MNRWIVVLTAFSCLGGEVAHARDSAQLRLKWEELDSHVVHKNTAFALPDGTRLEGKVLGVEQTGLHVRVSKSSNRRAHPKGDQLITRDSLSVLQVTEFGKKGRLLGTLGAIGIACGIVAAQQIDIYEGPALILVPAVIAVGVAGSAVAGYYAGKAYDKKVTEIWIVR